MISRWVPIETWPGKARASQIPSPFFGSWKSTLDLLERELRAVGADDVVIQGYFARGDLRLDGSLRADARPSKPGIVVSFKTKGQELSFPCDRYYGWQDNLRAIALALEALRKVDRYGVGQSHEQYRGWNKLPPAPEKLTPERAKEFLALHYNGGGPEHITGATFKAAYRAAAGKLHPDVHPTGNEHLWRLLSEAKQTLEDAYGWQA